MLPTRLLKDISLINVNCTHCSIDFSILDSTHFNGDATYIYEPFSESIKIIFLIFILRKHS